MAYQRNQHSLGSQEKVTEQVGVGSIDDETSSKSSGRRAWDQVDDPRFYKPIDTYEGIHRWDPEVEWTPEEEKKLVRKVR